jgi:hypothetical protein
MITVQEWIVADQETKGAILKDGNVVAQANSAPSFLTPNKPQRKVTMRRSQRSRDEKGPRRKA